MAALSHVLSVAVREWEWLDTNTAHRLRKLKEPRGRDRFLCEDDCARLLVACRTSCNPSLHDVALLAISTGMRRNEILSLRFNQLDVQRGVIYLYDTKNGERRGVPLAGPALAAMERRMQTRGDDGDLIFAGQTGVTPFDIRKPWYAALKATGLVDVRFHDLRHTAASFLAKEGASLVEIGAVLGQQSAAMTKRYAHFAQTHLRSVVENMNRQVFERASVEGQHPPGHRQPAERRGEKASNGTMRWLWCKRQPALLQPNPVLATTPGRAGSVVRG